MSTAALTSTGRLRTPLAMLMSFAMVVAALLSGFAVTTAYAQGGAPGESVTLTDANGNVFTYKITTVADGTGHGTNQQCYINGANGYTPGDDTPTDGYVCTKDSVEYRLDWNADIKTTDGAQVKFVFDNAETENPFRGIGTTGKGDTASSWNWSGGVTGGADLGFTGSGLSNTAQMTFTQTGQLSGYWTFHAIGAQEYVSAFNNGGIWDLQGQATMGEATGIARTDRPVTFLTETRFDVIHQRASEDSSLTTIGEETYRSISLHTNMTKGIAGLLGYPSIAYPNHHNTKGFYGVRGGLVTSPSSDQFWVIDLEVTPDLRFQLIDAPAGTHFVVDGGEPVPAQWDGTTAYVEARGDLQVKVLVPWGSLPEGNYTYVTKIDPTGSLIDLNGQATFNGASDPGVGLSCDVTTADVLPGARRGGFMPNNNCMTQTLEKMVYAGDIVKVDHTNPHAVVIDGTRYEKWALGSSDSEIIGNNSGNARFTVDLAFEPTGRSFDEAVCMAWDTEEMDLRTLDFLIDGQPLLSAVPDAKIYYSTQDLRPEGAPVSADAPVCGSPSDTSIWTTDAPATPEEQDAISAVMFVFPGENRFVSKTTISASMVTEAGSKYPTLVTENVRNYMGRTVDSTVAEPSWQVSTDAIMVLKSETAPYVTYENNSALGIGEVRYTSTVKPHLAISGAVPEGLQTTQRVYLDSCMRDVELSKMDSEDIVSYRVVGSPSTTGECGVSEDYYVEVLWNMDGVADGAGQWNNWLPFDISWTTPVTSAPGDEYTLRSTWHMSEEDQARIRFAPVTNDKTYRVSPSSVVGAVKSVDDPRVEINTPFSHTVGWYNYSPLTAGSTQFIDVLPYNGDGRGTSFSGELNLSTIEYVGGAANGTTYEVTSADPSTISSNPADASNAPGGSTTWYGVDELGTEGAPADLSEVTAIRFTTASFESQLAQYFRLTFSPTGNVEDDVYVNSLGVGVASDLGQPIPQPAPVQTEVFSSSIAGTVFEDADYSEAMDEGETPLEGYIVELLDAQGEVLASQVTGTDGAYLFDGLVSADYQVRLTDPQGYTVVTVVGTDVGDDTADRTSQVIELGLDEDVTDVNIGLFKVMISGTVYEDLDNNGDQEREGDSPEPGIEGYGVELLRDGEVVGSSTTDENGYYSFEGLVPGEYQVRIFDPQGRILTQSYTVSDPSGRTTDPTQPVTVETSDVHEIDFGLYDPLSVTVQKYGLVDGESALLPGAQFTLVGPDGELVMSVDEAGSAFFAEGLRTGQTYTLTETKAPEGTNLLATSVELVVTQDGIEIVSGGSDLIKVSEQDPFVLMVTDSPAVELPSTGGPGVGNGVLLGLTVLLLLVGCWALRNRRSVVLTVRS